MIETLNIHDICLGREQTILVFGLGHRHFFAWKCKKEKIYKYTNETESVLPIAYN